MKMKDVLKGMSTPKLIATLFESLRDRNVAESREFIKDATVELASRPPIQGPKGDKGDPGVGAPLINNLETGGTGAALTAEMGKKIQVNINNIEEKNFSRSLNIKSFGAYCDGIHDDSQALKDMLRYSLEKGISTCFVSGIIRVDLNEKITALAPLKIIGTGQSGAQFRFTAANGGFKFGDTTRETNELHMYNITLNGMRTTNTVLEIQRIMNIYFQNLRVGGTLDYPIRFYNQCGIVFWNEGGIDGNMNTEDGENWRLRQKGLHVTDINSLIIRNTNMWALSDVVTIEGYCTHLLVDSNWFEMCKTIFIYNVGNDSTSKNFSVTSRDNMYLQTPWDGIGYNFNLLDILSDENNTSLNSINEGLFITQNDRIIFNRNTNFNRDCLLYLEKYNGSLNISIKNITITMFQGTDFSSQFMYIKASENMLASSNINFKINVIDFSTTSTKKQFENISNVEVDNIIEQGRKNFGAVTTKRIKLTKSNPKDYTGVIYYADFNKSIRMHRTSSEILELVNVRKGSGTPIGSVSSDFIGQMYIDTQSEEVYISTGTGLSKWKKVNL